MYAIRSDYALKVGQLVEENRNLKARLAKDQEMIGHSRVISLLKEQIKIAAPTSGWVLITGENGTGNVITSYSIHYTKLYEAL